MSRQSTLPFFVTLTLLVGLLAPLAAMAAADGDERWAVVAPSAKLGPVLRAHPGLCQHSCQLGERTVLVGGLSLLETLKGSTVRFRSFPLRAQEQAWLMTTKDPALRNVVFPGVRQILRQQGFRVLVANETAAMGLARLCSDFTRLDPLPTDATLLTAPRPPTPGRRHDATTDLLATLSVASFSADLRALVDLKTRYTYSQGAVQGLDYCEKVLKDLGLQTRRLPFGSSGSPRENLEGYKPGFASGQAGEVVVVGHLDSTSPQASTLAPGADDNGSGAAGVLALARLIAGKPSRAGVRFVVVLGEEQGMLGSKAYVAGLKPEQLAALRGVINLDMIGFDAKPPASILLETKPFCKDFAQRFAELAAEYTSATTQIALNAWGSDHVPFLSKNVPTVLTIESEFDDNPTYHQITDTYEKVNLDLCEQILRLNGAMLAELAGVERLPWR